MALYVWGHNTSQQLGLDVADDQVVELTQVQALLNEVIVDFSAGERHSLALNEFGHVFAWGRGREGQLGLGDVIGVTGAVSTPRRINDALAGHFITKVSCGDSHSLALTVSGDVFMWGLLPVTNILPHATDDASDRQTVALTGLSQAEVPRGRVEEEEDVAPSMRHPDSSVMARLLDSMHDVYEHATDDENIKVQTIRASCRTPRLCTDVLVRQVVTNIAAGFAHSLVTTRDGAVFSCGYNDNGQLGLGTRRHAAEFQRIEALEKYCIDHIACGQQHSLACSRLLDDSTRLIDKDDDVRSGVCFSWGFGVLGQLGTGAHIAWSPQEVKLVRPAVSVAAGSHHSVAVTDDGNVYTWGHSEYGQHGAGETFNDLQHSAHYFFPRLQQALADDPHIHVESVSCSSHATFALTRDGSLMSWGWNAFGVLGNGKYQHSVHPQRVFGLKDNVAVAVGAGSNHCAVAVRPRGAHYSLSYDRVLANADFTDLVLTVGAPLKLEHIKAHRVVLCARSSYIRGYLRILDQNVDSQAIRSGEHCSKKEGDEDEEVVAIDLFQDVDAQVVHAFLTFLYTSRLKVVSHKRKALGKFACSVCCDALVVLCLDTWRKERVASLPSPSLRHTGSLLGDQSATSEARRFGEDMQRMVLSEALADVVLLWPIQEDLDVKTFERLPAHKAVLSQVKYFRTMFMGGFSEGKALQRTIGNPTDSIHEVSLHYMHRDGVSLEAFKRLLLWIYTGSFELLSAQLDEPSELMDLYVGASLLGLTVLANRCELQLVELLPQLDTDSLRACEDFAERYNAQRLQSMSQQVLEKQLSTND
uniref:BTB domain-containing protein n=1 Tax=Hyaloperonospora arabidopsidis (strain Emoy2) TaxID=559515 RepID=M4B7C0_HYAAE